MAISYIRRQGDDRADPLGPMQRDRFFQQFHNAQVLAILKPIFTKLNQSSIECIVIEGCVALEKPHSQIVKLRKGYGVFPNIPDADTRTAPFFSHTNGYFATTSGTVHDTIEVMSAYDPGHPITVHPAVDPNAFALYRSVAKELIDQDVFFTEPIVCSLYDESPTIKYC